MCTPRQGATRFRRDRRRGQHRDPDPRGRRDRRSAAPRRPHLARRQLVGRQHHPPRVGVPPSVAATDMDHTGHGLRGNDVRTWVLTRTAGAGLEGASVKVVLDATSNTSMVLLAYSGAGGRRPGRRGGGDGADRVRHVVGCLWQGGQVDRRRPLRKHGGPRRGRGWAGTAARGKGRLVPTSPGAGPCGIGNLGRPGPGAAVWSLTLMCRPAWRHLPMVGFRQRRPPAQLRGFADIGDPPGTLRS